MAEKQNLFCEKCKKTLDSKEFYGTNDLEKYPNGKLNQCKKCLTMFVDNWDNSTYLWILQECDVPYIPVEWDKLLAKYGTDRKKVTGVTIIGRYLSKMKLKQHKQYRWKDTEFLQKLADKATTEAMERQGYTAAEITEVIQHNRASLPTGEVVIPEYVNQTVETNISDFYNATPVQPQEDYFAIQSGAEEDDIVGDLTDEDRKYLRLKWGKSYRPEEWVKLEQLYNDMSESYNIEGAGHEDVLKLVCKTSLKSNQLLDIGDVDGAQKMVKMYDSLMKSGKFTAAQNKKEDGEFLNSISELVVICEKEGFIERYYTPEPKDRVDETILDLKNYTKSLVTEEMNLGNLIESAIKEMAREEAKEEDEDIEDDISFEELDALKDVDFEQYNDFILEEENSDEETIKAFLDGESEV